jgi:hypothetical protein
LNRAREQAHDGERPERLQHAGCCAWTMRAATTAEKLVVRLPAMLDINSTLMADRKTTRNPKRSMSQATGSMAMVMAAMKPVIAH